ncbi:MAG TPA: hypothetical protein VFX30_04225 [bacterium]|nr:hypothetical protein [bacterium]
MGEPTSSVSIDDGMLVSLYNTIQDEPNVVSDTRVVETNRFIAQERPLLSAADREYANAHGFFETGFPSALQRPQAHQILLGSVSHRLEGLGYTVNSVTSSGHGYEFHLSINGRPVTATLYPANADNDGDASFLTRLQYTAEILQSPAGATIASVDLESHTSSVSFRLADGGYVFLDNHYLSPTAFQNGSRAYRALRLFGAYGEGGSWSSPGRPVFTGSVAIDQNGTLSASYAYPGHGDMPHADLGRAAQMGDTAAIRARFGEVVDARIGE